LNLDPLTRGIPNAGWAQAMWPPVELAPPCMPQRAHSPPSRPCRHAFSPPASVKLRACRPHSRSVGLRWSATVMDRCLGSPAGGGVMSGGSTACEMCQSRDRMHHRLQATQTGHPQPDLPTNEYTHPCSLGEVFMQGRAPHRSDPPAPTTGPRRLVHELVPILGALRGRWPGVRNVPSNSADTQWTGTRVLPARLLSGLASAHPSSRDRQQSPTSRRREAKQRMWMQ
jgi:hypothetical protein